MLDTIISWVPRLISERHCIIFINYFILFTRGLLSSVVSPKCLSFYIISEHQPWYRSVASAILARIEPDCERFSLCLLLLLLFFCAMFVV